MGQKITFWVSKILQICLVLFSGIIIIGIGNYWIKFIQEQGLHLSSRSLIIFLICLIGGFIAISGCCYLLAKIPDQPNYNRCVLLGLLLLFALIFIFWLHITPTVQYSDYGEFWQSSIKVLKGQPLYQTDNDYFAKWAYQTGFLSYVMLIVKLFGAHIRIVQLLNVFYQLIILLLTYCLSQKLFHKVTVSRWSVFLLGINLEWFALNNRVTDQYIGLIFFLLTLILIIDDHRFSWPAAGITLALANYLRPLGIIFIAGIVVFGVVYRLLALPKNKLRSCGRIIAFAAAYFLLTACLAGAVKHSGLNEYGLSNRDPEWKLVMGLNYRSSGTNKAFISKQFNQHSSRRTMQTKERDVVKKNVQQLNRQHQWLSLLINKFYLLWAYPSNSLDYTLFRKNHSQQLYQLLIDVAFAVNAIEMLLLFIAAIAGLRKKMPVQSYLLLLTLFAYAAAQLIIEVQGRYRIEFTPILIIFASLGVQVVLSKIHERRVKRCH